MINKQGVWFLTLFSLILVLGIYYVTMPNELLSSIDVVNDEMEESKDVVSIDKTVDYIESLKIELDDKRNEEIRVLEEQMNDNSLDSSFKNEAYETIKELDEIKGIESNLEDIILEKYNLNSFVEISSEKVNVVIDKDEHDYNLANNIMVLVQNEFVSPMDIVVKFC